LTAVAGFDGHQGIALVVEPRTWSSPDDVLARAKERREPPFVLVLDSLEDPQNVGTLLRSAEAAGVHGVIFPTHHQAPLTPAAVKASAGAVEHLLLCPVDDLPAAMSDLRVRGLRIAAAEADAPLTAADADLRGPLAIVVGSEGQGLSPAVRRRADLAVRIPMRGAIGSLNAAVAGSILLFAAVAQRDPGTLDRVEDSTADASPLESPQSVEPSPEVSQARDPQEARPAAGRVRGAKPGGPAPAPAEPVERPETQGPTDMKPPRRRRASAASGSAAGDGSGEVPGPKSGARRTRRAKPARAYGDVPNVGPDDDGTAPSPAEDLLPGGPTEP